MIKSKQFENLLNEAGSLKKQGLKKEAILAYRKALKIKNNVPEIYNKIGIIFSELDKFDDAILNYKKALNFEPTYSIAYNNLGNALQFVGKINDAIINYEKAIKNRPNFSLAYRNLSLVKKFKEGDSHLKKMLDLVKNKNLKIQDQINLNYALGKAHNDICLFEKAFIFYQKANYLNDQRIDYKIENDEKFFKIIKNLFSNKISPLLKKEVNKKYLNKNPIFILGMPRSGSTLVEQIICSHSDVFGAGELEILDKVVREIDWKKIDDFKVILNSINYKYLSAIEKYNFKEKFITDKMPLNFRWIGFILLSIPGAKIIHTKRDPIATCWSIYKNFFKGDEHGFSYNMNNILRYYKIYLDLMNFWKKKFPDKIYDFSYEKVTDNIENESKKVINFLGLEWQSQCLDFHKTKRVVKTNSAYQVRQGLYKDSLSEWQNYKENLGYFLDNLK